jgi:hypothetical protein
LTYVERNLISRIHQYRLGGGDLLQLALAVERGLLALSRTPLAKLVLQLCIFLLFLLDYPVYGFKVLVGGQSLSFKCLAFCFESFDFLLTLQLFSIEIFNGMVHLTQLNLQLLNGNLQAFLVRLQLCEVSLNIVDLFFLLLRFISVVTKHTVVLILQHLLGLILGFNRFKSFSTVLFDEELAVA